MKAHPLRVVVDGSNLATEGRTIPSLVQLDDAVRAFLGEYDHADVIVVVDASFEHRVAPGERARFKEAEIAGEIVTPPAGAVGRGDAFILKIAQRIDAVVLSNDSFQEFHEQYPWLFDTGRLFGGKPVKGVGWVFTERLPVRGVKSVRATRAVKKLEVALPEGVVPTIGDTLTPVKAPRATKRAVVKATAVVKSPAASKTVRKAAAAELKEPKELKEPRELKEPKEPREPREPRELKEPKEALVAPPPRRAKKVATAKKVPAKKAAAPSVPSVPSVDATSEVPTVALRRGRQPVNPETGFGAFVKQFKVGAAVTGEVVAFTSHGAVIKVLLKNGDPIECYAPTTSLGDPAPARARDVLKRGDHQKFRLVNVDSERRIAELALP
ncbi:MAG: hypothetical protein HIU57_06545 [Acidobacteria bacterium]|nr:hypothetical protein [Acidobacteriota bacterium]